MGKKSKKNRTMLSNRQLAAGLILIVVVTGLSLIAWERMLSGDELRRVDSSIVCMVNDKVFDNVQIPVKINERTYYGCCDACEKALKQDPAVRTAIDPVSKNRIDKAAAVIAAQADGVAIYFESERTFKKYQEDWN